MTALELKRSTHDMNLEAQLLIDAVQNLEWCIDRLFKLRDRLHQQELRLDQLTEKENDNG